MIGELNQQDLDAMKPIVQAINEMIRSCWRKGWQVDLGGMLHETVPNNGYSHRRILYHDRKILVDFCDAGSAYFVVSSIEADHRSIFGLGTCVYSRGFPSRPGAVAGPWWTAIADIPSEIRRASRRATHDFGVARAQANAEAAVAFAERCKAWVET